MSIQLERGFPTVIEGKGLGGKKVNRVNVSLTNHFNQKLNKLAIACNMKPTSLAGLLIEQSLNNADLIAELQEQNSIHAAYKIVPVNNNGELLYVIHEGV